MPDDKNAAGAAGDGSQGSSGGTGSAGKTPSVDELVQALGTHSGFQQLLTGAAVGQAKRVEDRLSKQFEDFAAKIAAGPAKPGQGTTTDDKGDLAAQLKAATERASKLEARLFSERKQTALSAALTKNGCRTEAIEPALQLLMQRGDIKEVSTDDGQHRLVGTAKVSGVEQEAPLEDVVKSWLATYPMFRAAAGGGGSGAAGGRAGAVGGGLNGKEPHELTEAEYRALSPEDRKKVRESVMGTGGGGGGFWS